MHILGDLCTKSGQYYTVIQHLRMLDFGPLGEHVRGIMKFVRVQGRDERRPKDALRTKEAVGRKKRLRPH